MAEYRDLLRQMRITVTSPDRTIRLKAGAFGDPQVDMAPGSYAKHTAGSLERQVVALLRSGMAALRRGAAQARETTLGPRINGRAANERPSGELPEGAPLRRFQEALAEVELSTESTSGLFILNRSRAGEFRAEVHGPGMSRYSQEEAVRELQSAIANLVVLWQRKVRELQDETLGEDFMKDLRPAEDESRMEP